MDGQTQPTENSPARQAMPTEEIQVTKKPQFLMKDGNWYFSLSDGRLLGPFDKIYDTVMSEWRNTERVLTGTKMSEVLESYEIAA